jgi:hypothetical protein
MEILEIKGFLNFPIIDFISLRMRCEGRQIQMAHHPGLLQFPDRLALCAFSRYELPLADKLSEFG